MQNEVICDLFLYFCIFVFGQKKPACVSFCRKTWGAGGVCTDGSVVFQRTKATLRGEREDDVRIMLSFVGCFRYFRALCLKTLVKCAVL